jgi:hypothetical protein
MQANRSHVRRNRHHGEQLKEAIGRSWHFSDAV